MSAVDTAISAILGNPTDPKKKPSRSQVVQAIRELNDSIVAASAGVTMAASLTALNAIPGTRIGQPGRILQGADAGEYAWSGSTWVKQGPVVFTAQWQAFFNSQPILIDSVGAIDGTAHLHVPLRKFYVQPGQPLDVSTGTENTTFPGYQTIDIPRWREGDGNNALFVYYDLDDPGSPLKTVQYPSVPPQTRPGRIVSLITIYSAGFWQSPVRVIEISEFDKGDIWPYGAIVHDGQSILIPQFYQFHWSTNASLVAPSDGSKYFELPATENSIRRIYYDNVYHYSGAGATENAIRTALGNGYPRKGGYRLHLLCKKSGVNNHITSDKFQIAKIVANQWGEGKYPDDAGRLFDNCSVQDAPAALTALGFNRCVKSTANAVYYGGDFDDKLVTNSKTKVFGRIYIHSTVANSFPANPFILLYNGATFLGNVPLEIEKKVNSNVWIYSASGFALDGANIFLIGASNSTAANHSIAGGQFWSGNEDEPWISRNDYVADFSSLRPTYGKSMWMVQDRPMPLYLKNLIGNRNDKDLITGGMWSLKGATKIPYFVEGSEQIRINPNDCGTTGEIVVRRKGFGTTKSSRFDVPVALNISAATKTGSPKILYIGDSLTNGGLPTTVNTKLLAAGVTASYLGTINTSDTYFSELATDGPLAEGRGGRQMADYIYSIITGNVAPVTNVANYIAANKATKITFNPFLRAATGGDPANLINNGYVFDFAQYQTNYLAGVSPDIVIIGLGTNDRGNQTDANAILSATNGVRIMFSQIRAALPAAKIAWWMPCGPRSYDIDLIWERGNKFMRAAMNWILTNGDANMHIIPAWAHMSPEIGWWQNGTPATTDNVIAMPIFDTIHSGPPPAPLREQFSEALFAYIMNQL